MDTLLFSHIGMPLFHRYQVFDRPGTYAAFRGTYMQWMAEEMSRTALQDTGSRALDILSRPRTSRRLGSRARKSTSPAAVAVSSEAPGVARSHRSSPWVVPALRFASPEAVKDHTRHGLL